MSYRLNLRRFTTASVSVATLVTLVACAAPISAPRAPATIAATMAAPAAAPTLASAATPTAEANKAVVQSFYEEVVNQKHPEKMKDLDAPNIVVHELGLQAGDMGGVLTGLPDVKTTISLWVIEGDLVTAVVTFRGTHKGPLMGVAATGKPVSFSIIDIWRVKDGKLAELWHNVPNSDILAQISPPPATMAAPTAAPTVASAETPTAEATAVMTSTSTQAITSTAAMTNTAEANKAVVQSFYEEVVNQKHPEKMKDLDAPNIVVHELGLQAGDMGGVLTGPPDVKTTISLWVIEGDLVAAVVTFRGTHKGPLMGVAATGKPVSFSIIDIWRVKDGKLAELWHNVPNSDILAQMSPPPTK